MGPVVKKLAVWCAAAALWRDISILQRHGRGRVTYVFEKLADTLWQASLTRTGPSRRGRRCEDIRDLCDSQSQLFEITAKAGGLYKRDAIRLFPVGNQQGQATRIVAGGEEDMLALVVFAEQPKIFC